MRIKGTFLFGLLLALAAASGCSSSPSHVAYVGQPFKDSVAAYRISDDSGAFTKIFGSPFPAGSSPANVLVHPSNKFLYAANQIENTISLFTIESSTGALTEVKPRTSTGISPGNMITDSNGSFLFVANRASDSISVFSIDASSGALTAVSGSPFATPDIPSALALTPSGKFLYVTNPNFSSVTGYAVSAGVLQPLSGTFTVGRGPGGLIVDPTEHFLFVANTLDNTMSGMTIAADGSLSPVPTTPIAVGTGPITFAFDSTGKYLYVANLNSTNVSAFTFDATTGVPTAITGSPFSVVANPIFMVLSPSGKFLIIGSQSANTISEYTIDSTTGKLATASVSVTADAAPTSLSLAK